MAQSPDTFTSIIPYMKHFYAVFLCLIVTASTAQTDARKWLEGKLIAEFADLEGIHIMNINADYSTTAQAGGYFTTWAKPGDTLMFSAVHIKGKMIGLTADDFEKPLFFVRIESMVNQIDQVKVRQYKNITAESLGIVKNVKRYTPAERKLKTASDMSVGSIITLDPLFNWISGRTAMLKKEVEAERKEMLMATLENAYDGDYLTSKLKIPTHHVRGFLFYAVEDKELANLVRAKTSGPIEFRLAELAVQYNETIAGEK